MVQAHQPGEAVLRSILPEDIDWKPFPAFPSSVRLAVVVGDGFRSLELHEIELSVVCAAREEAGGDIELHSRGRQSRPSAVNDGKGTKRTPTFSLKGESHV
jgi:hypothetical protein